MRSLAILAAAYCLLAFLAQPVSADVLSLPPGLKSLELVTVADPGNTPDARYNGTLLGAVSYTYQIGKHDVTAAQYCEFLNAVAAADTYDLYNPCMADVTGSQGCNIQQTGSPGTYRYAVAPEWANRPVNYVSWADAARFCNWLTNGQPAGAQDLTTTEDGSYYLNGAMSHTDLQTVRRKDNARYVIPNEDEWYKAAYYDPSRPAEARYWEYPTRSDTIPSNQLDPAGTNNANYHEPGMTLGGPYYRTDVGTFANCPSSYGTFDQGGNVWQWNETAIFGAYRGLRGGSFDSCDNNLHASNRLANVPMYEHESIGFRIALVDGIARQGTGMPKSLIRGLLVQEWANPWSPAGVSQSAFMSVSLRTGTRISGTSRSGSIAFTCTRQS